MDARSLLRAKKAEARITHPYASYTAAGALRCSICATPVKQWDAHLLTKQHRTSVAREKAEKEKAERAKRPRAAEAEGASKRAKVQASAQDEDEGDASGPSGLPAGFFSAANKPAAPAEAGPSASASPASAPAATGDAELDDFLSSLADDAPPPSTAIPSAPAATTAAAKRKGLSYKEIAPGQASYEAAPVRIVQPGEEEAGKVEEKEPEESEAERRERLEREEREEIVLRLEEEERAQEDADSRVTALKQRMEMLKKRREAAKGGKTAKGKAPAPNGA
ncbi:hypothetical protein IAT38_006599 [Cryptococcus sp. DSM 104549]